MIDKIQLIKNLDMDVITNAKMTGGVTEKDHPELRANRSQVPMILVAAPPRAGANFLVNVIAGIASLNLFRYSSSYFGTEHDLYLPALSIARNFRSISSLHMKANYPSNHWINVFDIKPIVLVRNIFESIVSLAIYIRKRRKHPDFSSGYSSSAMAWIDEDQADLSDEQLMDMIIKLYIPWYIHFFVSWNTATYKDDIDPHWLTYEELKENTNTAVQNILNFCGLDAVTDDWNSVINAQPQSYVQLQDNSYSVSREDWRKKITSNHIEHIHNFVSYYPDIDFSILGL